MPIRFDESITARSRVHNQNWYSRDLPPSGKVFRRASTLHEQEAIGETVHEISRKRNHLTSLAV